MNYSNHVTGKLLYALLFLIVLPTGLFYWAKITEEMFQVYAIQSKNGGLIFMILGSVLMLVSMLTLMIKGKGLPMNAYPPDELVTSGPYRVFRHPIYVGFAFLLVGFFLFSGSGSGLWLVSPLCILGMIALVMGYETIELKKRFPEKKRKVLFDLPSQSRSGLTITERMVAIFQVLLLLVLVNFILFHFSSNHLPLIGELMEFEEIPFSPGLYIVCVVFILICPLLVSHSSSLRQWVVLCSIALTISTFIALLWPSAGAQYFATDVPYLISVPIFLTLLSMYVLIKQHRKAGFWFGLFAFVSILIQLGDSKSAIMHLISSLIVVLFAIFYFQIWIFLKNQSEKIANSWQEWIFGKVRIINHGFYVGAGAFSGIMLAGILAGTNYAWAILVFAFVVIIFSALWAQIIEGSEKLKRPYGYYGALVGIIFAGFLVWILGFNVWLIIGVISVFMPWVQAAGRMRCLINGCCHGSKTNNEKIGIRYVHPRSRVSIISDLKGELLHPTPLYSMLWLLLIGFVLLAFWYNQYSYSFIFGMYLILTSLGRFVEEAFRGEVQTPILKGLRLYQWAAIFSLLTGIVFTTIKVQFIEISPEFSWQIFLAALIGGMFTFIAMGVDFPYSNARFSRLV